MWESVSHHLARRKTWMIPSWSKWPNFQKEKCGTNENLWLFGHLLGNVLCQEWAIREILACLTDKFMFSKVEGGTQRPAIFPRRRHNKEAGGPFHRKDSEVQMGDGEKATLLSSYIAPVFCKWDSTRTRENRIKEGMRMLWPRIGKEVIGDNWAALNEFESAGLNELPPKVLKQLAGVTLDIRCCILCARRLEMSKPDLFLQDIEKRKSGKLLTAQLGIDTWEGNINH